MFMLFINCLDYCNMIFLKTAHY
uniref:Uncharacterized protein n=1 Tax=Anguilla anguilla TaxID=7936 RepID=A0A0E9P809_ANGAN